MNKVIRDYTIVKNAARANIYVLLGELWENFLSNQELLLYSSVKDKIAHIAVQLQHNDRFNNSVLLYWLYKLYCSWRLEEVHRSAHSVQRLVINSQTAKRLTFYFSP